MPREGGASSIPRRSCEARRRRLLDHPPSRVMTVLDVGVTKGLAFKLLAGDDLDAEARQSLVVVHRRGQVPDRGDAEIPQDLRADADLAPLLVAVGLGGFVFRQGSDRHPGRTVA